MSPLGKRISLRPITAENRAEILALKVQPHQRHWVASNELSLQHARENPQAHPEHFAIYADEEPVGFLMIGRFSLEQGEDPEWLVWRFMIDADHQRQGYGRAALTLVIEQVRTKANCQELRISFQPDNEPARSLYSSLGFVDRGEMYDGEKLMRLPIHQSG